MCVAGKGDDLACKADSVCTSGAGPAGPPAGSPTAGAPGGAVGVFQCAPKTFCTQDSPATNNVSTAADCAAQCQNAGKDNCVMWRHDDVLKQCFQWKPDDKLTNGCDVTGNYAQMMMGKLPSYAPQNQDKSANKIKWGNCPFT